MIVLDFILKNFFSKTRDLDLVESLMSQIQNDERFIVFKMN